MVESLGKTQFATTSVAKTRQLVNSGVDAAQITSEFEILGVQAALQIRQEGAKEKARVDSALLCAKLLSCLQLSFRRFHVAARVYALSKCYQNAPMVG